MVGARGAGGGGRGARTDAGVRSWCRVVHASLADGWAWRLMQLMAGGGHLTGAWNDPYAGGGLRGQIQGAHGLRALGGGGAVRADLGVRMRRARLGEACCADRPRGAHGARAQGGVDGCADRPRGAHWTRAPRGWWWGGGARTDPWVAYGARAPGAGWSLAHLC